jgi:hypothetical protein
MCTDGFTTNKKYNNIQEDMDPEEIMFSLKEKQDDSNTASITFISDVEDLDDLENGLEDGFEQSIWRNIYCLSPQI